MSLITLLENEGEQIVAEAGDALGRSDLAHYKEAGQAVGQERLAELFRLTVAAVRDRNLAPIMDYMAQVADDRFHAGYAIREVQIAINVLEEAIWNHIVRNTPPDELAEALGLVGTVLGAAKDALARAYVSLAGKSKAPSLDLSALFEGRTSG
ncbi:conserved protein of unknown function [Candidatus Promineifilum breve]|uniref:RsbT co-antagonist protein RsbRD N-terminal domain-containing protein n=1 Tax=Candidatus Promineifilum breve TaxID=1806508 RepID=A0A170PIT0_9CHLR|nr:hypothetical protein [Candidatus Promineifilum breve]CUS05013.2 conserved protein of unknown function [Candidatus Promineifilum breve]